MIYDVSEPQYWTFLANGGEGAGGAAEKAANPGGSGLSRRDCWG